MALTRINNQALTNVTSAGLPSGTVLQVQQAAFTGSHITTSSTSYGASSITDTITPTSASSKVMITLSGGHCSYNSGGSIFYKVVRTIGATSTDVSSATNWMEKNNAGNSFGEPISGNYLDSPSTTSAVTYTVHIKTNNGTVQYLTNSDSLLTITLMEIAG